MVAILCRFKSCYPHQKNETSRKTGLFFWCSGLRAGIPVRFAHSNVVGNLTVPLTPSENAAFFGALTLRPCAPHFFIGDYPPLRSFFSAFGSQKTAVTPLEALGRCLAACRVFYFPQPFFPGIAKELLAARRGSPPTSAPCLRHKPAYAGRCGGDSRSLRSLKCGREPDGSPLKRPLPDRFHESFPGVAKELLAARCVVYWAGIRYHIDNGIFSPGGWESRNRIYL